MRRPSGQSGPSLHTEAALQKKRAVGGCWSLNSAGSVEAAAASVPLRLSLGGGLQGATLWHSWAVCHCRLPVPVALGAGGPVPVGLRSPTKLFVTFLPRTSGTPRAHAAGRACTNLNMEAKCIDSDGPPVASESCQRRHHDPRLQVPSSSRRVWGLQVPHNLKLSRAYVGYTDSRWGWESPSSLMLRLRTRRLHNLKS